MFWIFLIVIFLTALAIFAISYKILTAKRGRGRPSHSETKKRNIARIFNFPALIIVFILFLIMLILVFLVLRGVI